MEEKPSLPPIPHPPNTPPHPPYPKYPRGWGGGGENAQNTSPDIQNTSPDTPKSWGGVFFRNKKPLRDDHLATTYLEGNHKRNTSIIHKHEKRGDRQKAEIDW